MKIGVLLFLSFVLSCSTNTGKTTKTLWINSFKVPCTGVAPMSCLQVKESTDDKNWSSFYNQIEGFDFTPGYLYTIKVRVENIPEDQIVADGSSIRYILKAVIAKKQDKRLAINDIWVLETIDGKSVVEIFEKLPYLEVQLSSSSYMGNDGCNNFNGKLEAIEEKLVTFSSQVSTKVACPNQDLSLKFMENLRNSNEYKIEKGMLTLLKDSIVLLTFKKTD